MTGLRFYAGATSMFTRRMKAIKASRNPSLLTSFSVISDPEVELKWQNVIRV